MNIQIVTYLAGRLCLFLASFMCLPLFMSVYYKDAGEDCFLGAVMLAVATAMLLLACGKFDSQKDTITNREGMFCVVFSWVVLVVLGAVPYYLAGQLSVIDSLFESMAGLSTVGSTVITDVEALPQSLLFWRTLSQWVGGLGIIVIFVALLPQISGSVVHLYYAETTGFADTRLVPKIKDTAIILFVIYSSLTLAAMLLLYLCGLSPYNALMHALATVSTGGFSPYNASIMHFDSLAVEAVVVVFMFLAGVNFDLYFTAVQRGWKVFLRNVEFRTYIKIILALSALIALDLMLTGTETPFDSLRFAIFQVVSFTSTAGFVGTNYDTWPAFAKFLLCILFFTGACAGSTSGGIKISRIVVLLRALRAEIDVALHPNSMLRVQYGGRILPLTVVTGISRFFFLYIFCIVVGSLALTLAGIPTSEAVFGMATCMCGIGTAFGNLGAAGNYSALPGAAKIILIVTMLIGRLEMLTVLVLLRKEFWQRSRRW